jgi:hypothetical protein|tara:strand:+ start:355 stop:615 length:261 start_codon:yes stop_codon:yes gene_type:complete
MTFNAFTEKLGEIQYEGHLSIDDTIYIKRQVVGFAKKLWDCTEDELDTIMDEYRNKYKKKKYNKDSVYSKKHGKSKHKYSKRKDWE